MNRLVIVAHAPLASALKAVAAHAYCEFQDLHAVDVQPTDTQDQVAQRVRTCIAGATGALILTDALGATPCNAVQRLVVPGAVHAVAGVNVPMLWRALCYAHKPLAAWAECARAGAVGGVAEVGGPDPQGPNQGPEACARTPT
jgi:mannose PTS system EIIA component